MHSIFLDSAIINRKQNNWNVDMQLHAYLCSLINYSVQYKL